MKAIAALFALFLGTSLFVAGGALLTTALGLRADALGFSASVTGAVMAAYFAGFVVGTLWGPSVVARAGHVRAFSAFAAAAAAAVLLHSLWVGAAAWALLRFVTGACVVGLYMVIESWLNERSANDVRGRVFAVYQVISLVALALGQYLLLIGADVPFTPFVLASALFSIGLIPVVLTRVPQPAPISTVRLNLRALWSISPLGVAGTFSVALGNGALLALGPVFAQRAGYGAGGVALFMSLVLLGGIVLQWPVGHLSDRWDRRTVILGVNVLGAALAGLASALLADTPAAMFAAMFLYGGAAFVLYPLCVSHANDFAPSDSFVATASGLLLVYGIGATVGPLLAGAAMQWFGTAAFLSFLMTIHVALALFILARMRARAAPPAEQQEPFVLLDPMSHSALELLTPDPQEAESPPPGGVHRG